MPKQIVPVQNLVKAGAAPTFTACTQVDLQVTNDGHTILEFKNTNAATRTITVQTPGTVDGNAVADPVATIAANTGDLIFKPFAPTFYNQADGNIYVDLSAFADVTVAAYRP